MPTRVDVWDREARRAISMFTGDATDAVANDSARYTLDIPAAAERSPPPREFDVMANLFTGQSTGATQNEHRRSNFSSPRQRGRRARR